MGCSPSMGRDARLSFPFHKISMPFQISGLDSINLASGVLLSVVNFSSEFEIQHRIPCHSLAMHLFPRYPFLSMFVDDSFFSCGRVSESSRLPRDHVLFANCLQQRLIAASGTNLTGISFQFDIVLNPLRNQNGFSGDASFLAFFILLAGICRIQ
jgi:hypothetical protein